MPNCDFYATVEDQRAILGRIFADDRCDVYESYSSFDQPLRQLRSADEVLHEYQRLYPNGNSSKLILVSLYVRGAGPAFSVHTYPLKPETGGGATFRSEASGWGLISLLLRSPEKSGLDASNSNHISRRRAESWSPSDGREDLGSPDAWDFEKITAYSSRLNRQIRKLAVAKLRARVVLPGAFDLWRSGLSLIPYRPAEHASILQRLGPEKPPPRKCPCWQAAPCNRAYDLHRDAGRTDWTPGFADLVVESEWVIRCRLCGRRWEGSQLPGGGIYGDTYWLQTEEGTG